MQKTYLQQVGERVYDCRTRNFFSRRKLAERAGVELAYVKIMERGEQEIGIEDAIKICKELNCSIEYILTGNCGLEEVIKLNRKILNLPDICSENLQKIAKAFWNSCPK